MNDNTGHGHVWVRPDGMKARCGGPTMCTKCAIDAGKIGIEKVSTENQGNNMNSKELLTPAVRQYMHNDGNGIVFGYDMEETENIVGELNATSEVKIADLIEVIKVLRQTVMEVRHAQNNGPGWYTKGATGLYTQVRMHLDRAKKAIQSVESSLDT